jgi:hypothetical protein
MLALRILLIVAALVAIYVFMVRPILQRQAALAGFYKTCDSFWEYLAELFRGWKTILWSRFLILAGFILPLLDLTSLLPWTHWLPPSWQPLLPFGLAVIGAITEWLRRITTTPATEA